MGETMGNSVDGFYVAYLTGIAGSSMGMFVFRNGYVTGADIGGGRYDGEFKVQPNSQEIEGKIIFTLPVGNFSITGIDVSAEPLSIEVPFKLPVEITPDIVYRIETPVGPVNARFEKLRGFADGT